MPRVLRKSKRRTAGYSEHHEYQLLHGHDIFDNAFGNSEYFDADAAKVAWDLLSEQLMARWIREQPGTRPAAWWWFDAPARARRERVDGGVHPFDNAARTAKVANSNSECLWKAAYRLTFGLPAAHIMPFDKGLKAEMFEPEWSFLVRHNLLLPEDSPEFLTPKQDEQCPESDE